MKCPNCGNEFDGVRCFNCDPDPNIPVAGETLLDKFEKFESKWKCDSIEACLEKDPLTDCLWKWGGRIGTFGTVLLVFIIVGGFIISIVSGFGIEESYYNHITFNAGTMFISLFYTACIAILELCIYQALSLFLRAMARIHHNTRVTAKLAEYNARKNEK